MTATHRTALLDVDVLVALAWPNHEHHVTARQWFADHHRAGWATTPITESGFVRVSSNHAAIQTASSPELAVRVLTAMIALDGHQFWVDDVPLVTGDSSASVPINALMGSHRHVTNAHLLALAESHGGTLVTFDTRIRSLLGSRDSDLLTELT